MKKKTVYAMALLVLVGPLRRRCAALLEPHIASGTRHQVAIALVILLVADLGVFGAFALRGWSLGGEPAPVDQRAFLRRMTDRLAERGASLEVAFENEFALATRDTIPSHLLIGPDISADVADFYTHVCPAGVYEQVEGQLRVNPANCVDCKATDVLGPRWTPREGGSGPKYRLM